MNSNELSFLPILLRDGVVDIFLNVTGMIGGTETQYYC